MSQAASSAGSAPTASAPGASVAPDWAGVITSAHLVFIAVFAALAIAAIIYGVRLKQRRKAALREVAEQNDALPDQPDGAAPPVAEAPATSTPAAPAATAAPAPSGDGSAADGPVTQLKGLGPKLTDRLAELGITTVGQIAALSDDEAHALDAKLGPFSGRMARDRWLEQARFLAAGDRAGFEAVFGRL